VISDRPSVISGLDVNEVKDGLIVYDAKRDRVHYLNATASIVFTLCDGKHDGGEIADVVATAFQLEKDPTAEVDDCISTFAKEGLLR
jgi:hypothetical protein